MDEIFTPAKDPYLGARVAERYRVLKMLGSGGWGRVYEVTHDSLNKTFAMKVLHTSMNLDAAMIKRFQREAEAISKIEHPGICRVYDLLRGPDGAPCIVMEKLSGRGMDAMLKPDGRLPWRTVADIGVQLLSALEAAHEAGIVHRDLKPSNIFIDETGKVKLLDFGLAKIDRPGDKSLTETGMTLGSPPYMSPEQCLGKGVDERADIYSLGCVLYEAVTGRGAVSSSSVLECMNNHLSQIPLVPSRAAPDVEVPEMFDEFLMQCLEKDPKNRFRSAKEARANLQACLAGDAKRSPWRKLISRHQTQRMNNAVNFLHGQLIPGLFVVAGLGILWIVVYIWQLLLAPDTVSPPVPTKTTSVALSEPASLEVLGGEPRKGAGPTPHVKALMLASSNIATGMGEAEKAALELSTGNIGSAKARCERSIDTLRVVADNIRTGVGGDFNLGELPNTNPLRRVGSARHSVRDARNTLTVVVRKLSETPPDKDTATDELTNGIDILRAAKAKLDKAIASIPEE